MNKLISSFKEQLHQLYKGTESQDHQLLYLFLEITRACNLACRHCGSDCSSKSDISTLTPKSWLNIINDVAESFAPLPTVVLTGGEPILNPAFSMITEALCDYGFRWGMVSNGYALDDKTFKSITKNKIYSITISLDGTESSHNWLRTRMDAYCRTVQTLRRIAESDIPEKDVVTCVNPRNIGELDSIAEALLDLRIPSWRLFRIFPAGRAKNNDELLLNNSDTKYLLDWIANNRKKYSARGLVINFSCEGWLPFSLDTQVRNNPFFCRAGINIGSILCDGTITGCTNNAERFYEGNILKDSFPYVWQNGFRRFRDRRWVETTNCGSCTELKKCQGSSIHLWRDNAKRLEFCYLDCVE